MTIDMMNPAMERINRELEAHFGSEVRTLESALSRYQQAEQALLRPDGSKKYSDAEHADRRAGLLESLDSTLATVDEKASAAIAQADAELSKLEGADPLDSLTVEQQTRAAARREFVKEDAERLRPDQLAERIGAALASEDTVLQVLLFRYAGLRLETRQDGRPSAGTPTAELLASFRELETKLLGDPVKRREQRQKIEQRISSAKVLQGKVDRTRMEADGRMAQARDAMRRETRSYF